MIKRLQKLTPQEIERLHNLAAYAPCSIQEIDSTLQRKNWVTIDSQEGATWISSTAQPNGIDCALFNGNGTVNKYWLQEVA